MSSGTVSSAVSRARGVGLTWEGIVALGDEALDEGVNGPRRRVRDGRRLPDPAQMHVELRKVIQSVAVERITALSSSRRAG